MMKTKIDWRIVVTAIIGIVALELGAMYQGINGIFLTLSIAAIAGLAGWTMPQLKFKQM